ncbi:PAS domain S-box protein [Catenovulum sp. SX2]|uniref:PAS domain-containing sensor histidine kinase n=1 Tax=Catenovulum sp. SX2 TaxID=3398614 RepID=UPI003F858E27
MEFLRQLMNGDYMPHGHCLLWKPDLLIMNVASDLLITLSYFAIPAALVVYGRQKPMPYRSTLIMFSMFIFACGITHIMAVINVWNGYYYLHGVIKVFTALVSFATAVLIWRLLPEWLNAPSLLELNTLKRRVEADGFKFSDYELLEIREYLEEKISERTEELNSEIARREEAEDNLNRILDSAAYGLLLVDETGKIVRYNEKAVGIFELKDELLTKNVSDFVDGEVKSQHHNWVKSFFASPNVKAMAKGRMVRYRTPTKMAKTLNIELQPYTHAGKNYCLATIMDVTVTNDLLTKLNQSELKFKTIANSVDAVLWLATPKLNKILYVNPAYEKLWQASCESLYENPISYVSRVHPEDREILKQRAAQHEGWDVRYRLRKPSGEICHIREQGKPVHNEVGELAFVVGMAVDITDSVELEEIQKKYEMAINAINDGVYDWDLTTDVITVSGKLKQMHGLSEQQEWLYQSWAERVEPEHLSKIEQALQQHLNGEVAFFYAEYPVDVLGKKRWMLTRGRVVEWDVKGKPIRLVGIETDITNRKQIEEELWLVGQKLSALQASAVDALVYTDVELTILEANKTFANLLGYETAQLLTKSLFELTPTNLHGFDKKILNEQIIPEGFCEEYEKVFLTKQGDKVAVSVCAWAVKDNLGDVTGIMCLIRDISARKHAEQTIHNALAELKRKNEELDQFVYAASHDLKEPSRGIMHIAQFLYEDYAAKLDEDGQKYIVHIRSAAERMFGLIESLLKFSRTGRREINREYIDMNVLVDELLQQTRSHKNFKVTRNFSNAKLFADRLSVFEILQNLLSNALKYSQRTLVEVEIGEDKGTIWVKDNGVGMSKESCELAFIIFKRLNKVGEGEGIGLNIVKRLVELHDGRVWMESAEGQGTQVYFTLDRQD